MAVLTPPGCLGLISCYLVNPCPALGLQSQWFLRARAWHLLPHSLTDWRPRLAPRKSAGHWWSWPCPPPPESSSRMACCLPACSCAPAGAEWHRQGVGFGEAANAAGVEGCRVVNNFGGMQVDAAALRPETLLWLGNTHCHRNAMPCPTPPCAHHHRAARRTHHPLHVVGRRVNAKRGLQENAPHLVHHLHGRSRLRQSNAWLRMLMREVIALSPFKTHAAAQPEPPRSSAPVAHARCAATHLRCRGVPPAGGDVLRVAVQQRRGVQPLTAPRVLQDVRCGGPLLGVCKAERALNLSGLLAACNCVLPPWLLPPTNM